MAEFIHYLASTSLSLTFQNVSWVIPAVQTVHILAIATLVGALLMIILRIARPANSVRTLQQVGAQFFPWAFGSLVVLLLTGVVLIIAEPARTLSNTTFWLKMGLLLVALVIIVVMRRRSHVGESAAGPTEVGSPPSAALAISTAVLLVAIIFAGRWIAYTEPLIY